MIVPSDTLRRQIDVLWERDKLVGSQDSIYRRMLDAAAVFAARAVDYAAGVERAMTTRDNVAQAIRWYKHANHAAVIDIGIFRVGFERGQFVAARQPGNTLGMALTVPRAQTPAHAGTHFIYVPFAVGMGMRGGARVVDVRQPFVSVTPTTLHLAPGTVTTHQGVQVVTPDLLFQLGEPILDFIPAAEHLLRPPPSTRLR